MTYVPIILGILTGVVIAIIGVLISLSKQISVLFKWIGGNKQEHDKIIDRLPNKVIIDEGVAELRTHYLLGDSPLFNLYPKNRLSFVPKKTNIYDLIDFKGKLYDNISKLQVVQEKDLKEKHDYYRVTIIERLEQNTTYFYIGEETKETKPKTTRTKKETTKIEKEENDKNE